MPDLCYQISAQETLQRLSSDAQRGLSSDLARERLERYGPNELVERPGRTRLQIIVEQFANILTLILVGAALVSLGLGETVEAVVILAIVVLNGLLGYIQEYRAEQSMAALKRMSVPTVRVRRDEQVQEISARELVPGDVVILETGNVVPADGRVLRSSNLRIMEAALTGESEAVDKDADVVFSGEKPLGDRRNMAYMGTVVNYGHGEMVVTATGMATELGKIADLIQSVQEEETPLQQRLDQLGKWLALAALIIVGVVFLLGMRTAQSREDVLEVLLTAVSLAVAAIPEAMTAVVTIALSLGAQRMLKREALIRKLPAVETLGSVSIICSDKTGTLTQNQMTVTALDVANHRIELMQRPGDARFALQRSADTNGSDGLVPTLDLLLVSGALCNDSLLVSEDGTGNGRTALGDPTESALVLAAAEAGIFKDDLDLAFPRVAELPFESVRKRMTTVHRTPHSAEDIPASLLPIWERRLTEQPSPYVAFTKGAIDGLLEHTQSVWVEGELQPFDDHWQQRVLAAHDQLAENGMRVLGVALRTFDHPPASWEMDHLEEDLTLVGLFGMLDPPRPEVSQAVATCRRAGIRPVMITGDHPLTARHIAQQIGITDNDRFITGQELDQLSEGELRERAHQVSVFARVSPEHKLRLISVYQEGRHIVAMTGDGVNDAPALKKADMGVAMGITGTDVSKEAAEMVLLDDNFATIVAAVEEGRVIYDNIRKFIKYLLTCNASEVAVMLLGPFLGLPLPLLPLQILWMNLVTDGLPALALGVEPAEKNVMQRPPYSSEESIFGRGMVPFIIVFGVVMSIVALAVGVGVFRSGDPRWQTVLFTTLIFAQLALALEVRSEQASLRRTGLFSNRSMVLAIGLSVLLQLAVIYVPVMQGIFGTVALSWQDLLIAVSAGLVIIMAVELWKVVARRLGAR
jgi:Ca2+-transporting ATPase